MLCFVIFLIKRWRKERMQTSNKQLKKVRMFKLVGWVTGIVSCVNIRSGRLHSNIHLLSPRYNCVPLILLVHTRQSKGDAFHKVFPVCTYTKFISLYPYNRSQILHYFKLTLQIIYKKYKHKKTFLRRELKPGPLAPNADALTLHHRVN